MRVGNSLQRLGRFLEKCERRAGVQIQDSDITVTDAEARAELEVALDTGDPNPSSTAVTVLDSSVDTDGTVTLSLESSDSLVPPHSDSVDIELSDITLTPTATVTAVVTARATVDTANAEDVSSRSGRTTDVPVFRDPERLSEIYASCETFNQMADAIEIDVSAETVRRYMIRNGIHEPDSYDTGETNGDAEPDATHPETPSVDPGVGGEDTPPIRTDGMGLPESVTVDDLVEAVHDASTIREVGRHLGIDRMDAFELLTEFDLIEFVMGRLTPDDDREDGQAEILERLCETTAQR